MKAARVPWELPTNEAELLALAKSYPFDAPKTSYLLCAGRAQPVGDAGIPPGSFEGRVPVIAYGSNRAPAQLVRKFGAEAEIPVTLGWLSDYDVVYSAHVTRYGSIAANLHHAPGVRAELSVTWLTQAQLARMHLTEFGGENYAYGRMSGLEMALEAGPARLQAAYVYLSMRGCLARGGAPVGLSAVAATGRRYPTLSQAEVLELVHARHGDGMPLDAHILETIRSAARRRAVILALAGEAVPSQAPHFAPLPN